MLAVRIPKVIMTKQEVLHVREQCKMLALAVGVREAARRLGLNENRVIQWSRRFQWLKQPDPKPQPPAQRDVITVIRPSDSLAIMLAERKDKSRLNLSKYVTEASEKSAKSSGNHKLARTTKDVASIYEKVWPEERENAHQNLVNIQILNER